MFLPYIESQNGKYKKSALEVLTYAKKSAEALGVSCVALCLGKLDNGADLGNYGVSKILVADAADFHSQTFSQAIANVAKSQGARLIVMSNTSNARHLVGRLSVKLNADSVSGATTVPTVSGSALSVKKNVFSGKGIANYVLSSPVAVVSVMNNSVKAEATGGTATVEAITLDAPAARVKVKEVKTVEGTVPLPQAELVVSGGRGLKGPENWNVLLDLASAIGATTACSRPVAADHWRPHHEHVGQTGVAIRPNLYIAIGISGAIQHLAGVNQSKCIVVINKDPEAPFFKAADYGVCGDLFEVLPRLTAAVNKLKHS